MQATAGRAATWQRNERRNGASRSGSLSPADRLFWEGSLQREDLIARFGLSPAQATADIARLRDRLGSGIAYDISRRAYVPSEALSDAPSDAAGILAELRLMAEGIIDRSAGILSEPPTVEMVAALARAVDREVLRHVIWAIRDHKMIEATYVSFQRPEVTRRLLSPHALVFDGFRWHARCHDAGDGCFKDFLLSRLSEPRLCGEAEVTAEADVAWQSWRVLTIVPHPGLGEHQKRVVMLDYGMVDGELNLTVREAVIFYVKRRLGLVESHERRPAHEQHVVLKSDIPRA